MLEIAPKNVIEFIFQLGMKIFLHKMISCFQSKYDINSILKIHNL